MKNIAMAIQIYLTDYDRFPPGEHDAEYHGVLDTMPGGNGPSRC